MDQIPENQKSVSGWTVPTERQLPTGRNKVERISDHSKGLFADMREWMDLKVELVKLEVQHELETKKNEFIVLGFVGSVSAVALLFLLTAIAFGLGAWLGHPAWGFLIVAGVLFLVAGVYWSRMGPTRIQRAAEVMVEAANPDPKNEKDSPEAKRKAAKKL
jgi:hypothetical protein